jgi:uncharacterized coiled-coil DUF342 family protein
MSRATQALLVVFMACVGLWGCAQSPSSAEKIKSLEARLTKLEEDYQSAIEARDSAKKTVVALEEERTKLKQNLEESTTLVHERTGERDAAQSQLDQVRKGLRDLLGQMETGTSAALRTGSATAAH